MAQTQRVIVSKDIYHGLPVFSEDLNGLTAIVTGANGISGDHMVGYSTSICIYIYIYSKARRLTGLMM